MTMSRLSRNLVEKPWGRDSLPAAFGVEGGGRIGEIWYDRPGEPLPILVKWLFTSEKLSVQVHPDDAQAAARGQPSGKEECWYIVDAEPDAVLGMGTTRALGKEELRRCARDGSIETLMDWKPVQAGDYFYIPAGTVHAIGAGITLVEVQQNADITYRLYDYGRPRELHLDDAVAVSDARPYADPRSGRAEAGATLFDGPLFGMAMLRAGEAAGQAVLQRSGRKWLIPISGTLRIDGDQAGVGECVVTDLPVDLDGSSDAGVLIAWEFDPSH